MFGRSRHRVERQPSHYWPTFSHLRRVPSTQSESPSSLDVYMDAIHQILQLTRQVPWWNIRARWRQRYLRRRRQANAQMFLVPLIGALLDTQLQLTPPLRQQINTVTVLQQLLGNPLNLPTETLASATTADPSSQEIQMLAMLSQLLAMSTNSSGDSSSTEEDHSAEPASVRAFPAPAHHDSAQVLHRPEKEQSEESPSDLPMTGVELSRTMGTESRPTPTRFSNGELDMLDQESREWMKNVLHVDLHRPTLSRVECIEALLRHFEGVPIGEWPILEDNSDKYIDPETIEPTAINIPRLPYHDQASCMAAIWDFNLKASRQPIDKEDLMETMSTIRPRLEHGLTQKALMNFDNAAMLFPQVTFERFGPSLSLLATRSAEMFAKGCLHPILLELDRLPTTKVRAPDENGYTCIFDGGTEVSLEELHNELNVPNREETEKISDDVVTIAISYSPCLVGSSTTRISLSDAKGIAEFIKKSHKTRLRFWIDSKLPPSKDNSLRVWLRRHIRPFAKYFTIVCPSADVSPGFWLTAEKLIAQHCKGYFSFEENGIYLRNSKGEPPVDLDRWMLKLLLRIEDLHPGMDRGETIRWVMHYLASEYNYEAGASLGMKFEEQDEEDDVNVTSAIRRVVRKDGPLKIPIRSGEGWNKQNPLVERDISGQNFELGNWLGLATDEDKRVVYFLLYGDMYFVKLRSAVVLRVTLTRPYDFDGTVCIESKELVELSSGDICKLKCVTAPWLCDWH